MSKQLKVILFFIISFYSSFSFAMWNGSSAHVAGVCGGLPTLVSNSSTVLCDAAPSPSYWITFDSLACAVAGGTSANEYFQSKLVKFCDNLPPPPPPNDCSDTSTPEALVKNITSDGMLTINIGAEPKLYKDGCEYEQASEGNQDSCYHYEGDILCSSSYVKTGINDSAVDGGITDGLTPVADLPNLTDQPVDISPDPEFDECFSPVDGSQVCRPYPVDPIDPDAPESCWLVNGSKTCSYGFEDFVDAGYVPLDDPLLEPKNCIRSDSGAISCIEIDPAKSDFKLVDALGNEVLISDKLLESKSIEVVTNPDGSVTTIQDISDNLVGSQGVQVTKVEGVDGSVEESTTYTGGGSGGSGSDSLNLGGIEKNTFDTAQGIKAIEAFLGDKSGEAGLPEAGLGGDSDVTIKGVIDGVFDGAEASLSSSQFGSESFIDVPQYFQFSGGCQGLQLDNSYVSYYFDPCEKLAPMRTFLGWFLSILTVYSILLIFVRSST